MGFPHCPICVAVAFLTACITVTRGYFFYFLYNEFVKRKSTFGGNGGKVAQVSY